MKVESPFDTDPAQLILGPFGNPNKSKLGDRILNLMREFQLRAATTFYDNNRTTKRRQAYQIDHIFIPKYQLNKTSYIKRKFNGAHSDIAALLIEFQLASDPAVKCPKKGDHDTNSKTQKKIDNAILRKKEIENFRKKSTTSFTTSPLTNSIYSLQTTYSINSRSMLLKLPPS